MAGLAADAIRTSGEPSAEPALRTALAVLEYAEERYERVLEIIDAVPRGHPHGPEDPRSDVAAAWRCDAQAVLDGLDVALAETSMRLAAAEREGRAWAVHIWLAWRGRLLFQAGRLDDGRANLDAALAMADVDGANVANAAALLTLGRIGLHTGDDGLVATAHRLGAERVDQRLPSMSRPRPSCGVTRRCGRTCRMRCTRCGWRPGGCAAHCRPTGRSWIARPPGS